MKKKDFVLCDNRGATMILVIISIAFVAILATLTLSLTMSNYQMKVVDQKSKANFYEAETAIDEIKAGLVKDTANALEEAYNAVMEQFLTTSESEKEEIFQQTFLDAITNELQDPYSFTTYNLSKLEEYITNPMVRLITPIGSNLLMQASLGSSGNVSSALTLKRVMVEYVDSNDYQSTITTDIVIQTPNLAFGTAIEQTSSPNFMDYGLLADNKITIDTAPGVRVNGNIYAGSNGINIMNNSSLLLDQATEIVTRGDIGVAGLSTLTVKNNPDLWVKNLEILRGNDTSNNTTIQIDGNCYVADDLMLNAKNSVVKINGEYYGYSYEADKSTDASNLLSPGYSSAIIINGENTNLDLSGLNKLFLSGRAYLNPHTDGNESELSQDNVLTGEALAVKGNQYAYLVPKEYIWCGTNPVSLNDYNNRPQVEVDFNKSVDSLDGLNIKDYVNGFLNIYYQASSSMGLVYYYLDFKSQEAANEYLQKYYAFYQPGTEIGIIDNRIAGYSSSIKLMDSLQSVLSAGNIFTYSDTTGKSDLIHNNVNPDDSGSNFVMEQMSQNLVNRYDTIQTTLKDTNTENIEVSDSVFQSIINDALIHSDNNNDPDFSDGIKKIVEGNYVVTIVENSKDSPYEITTDTSLPENGLSGIVIATGSVRVKSNFTGIILSGDEITLDAGVTVSSSPTTVESILKKNNNEINRYFKDIDFSDSDSNENDNTSTSIQAEDLIHYNNWEKNEE